MEANSAISFETSLSFCSIILQKAGWKFMCSCEKIIDARWENMETYVVSDRQIVVDAYEWEYFLCAAYLHREHREAPTSFAYMLQAESPEQRILQRKKTFGIN